MDTTYRLEPLPAIPEPEERRDYFIESEMAHAQYLGHRSAGAPANTTTYHIVGERGEVAGFVSFRVVSEEFDDLTVIHFSVEYIYVMQKFRMHGLGRQLLEPLVQAVQATVHEATSAGSGKSVRLQSASHPESLGGSRLLRELETRVCGFAGACGGVAFIGRYINPPVYIASSWERRPRPCRAPEVLH